MDCNNIFNFSKNQYIMLSFCISPASDQFKQLWNGNASSHHGYHPEITSISQFSSHHSKCERKPASSLFWFFNTCRAPSKIGKNCCEMWDRNEACPTRLPIKSGKRSELTELKVWMPLSSYVIKHNCEQTKYTLKTWSVVKLRKILTSTTKLLEQHVT